MKVQERTQIWLYALALAFCVAWLVTAVGFYVGGLLPEHGLKTAGQVPQRCEIAVPCVVTLENGTAVVIP